MNTRPLLPFLAAAIISPPLQVSAQQPPADPADVESIDAIMKAVYDVISGDAGVKRDWDRFRSLFAPGATLSPTGRSPEGVYSRQIITPGEYAQNAGAWLEENGLHEVEINRVTERYSVIAHAFSTYESRRLLSDPEPFARGINSFQLMYDGTRWWVVSIFWQQESEEHPIPARYLPAGWQLPSPAPQPAAPACRVPSPAATSPPSPRGLLTGLASRPFPAVPWRLRSAPTSKSDAR